MFVVSLETVEQRGLILVNRLSLLGDPRSHTVKAGSLVSLPFMVPWENSIDKLYRLDIVTNGKRSLVWKGWFGS